jgi:hypothetical protein
MYFSFVTHKKGDSRPPKNINISLEIQNSNRKSVLSDSTALVTVANTSGGEKHTRDNLLTCLQIKI